MYETPADLERLQDLLDRSYERAGKHLRAITTPQRRLGAGQVVTYLQGIKHIVMGTATADGRPRVGPVDGFFVRGRFHCGTAPYSMRVRHLRQRPAVSATHLAGDDVAITVHGKATLMEQGHPDIGDFERAWREAHGTELFSDHAGVVVIRIEPESMFTFALDPAKFPEPT